MIINQISNHRSDILYFLNATEKNEQHIFFLNNETSTTILKHILQETLTSLSLISFSFTVSLSKPLSYIMIPLKGG